MDKNFKIEVDDKYISNIYTNIKDSSIPIAELIWNSLDADSKKIEIDLEHNGGGGLLSISVTDDGHGIDMERLNDDFKSIGKTTKANKDKSPEGRFFHGKKGSGRYTPFCLGTKILWKTTYKKGNEINTYSLLANKAKGLRNLEFIEPIKKVSPETETGTIVRIDNMSEFAKKIEPNELRASLIAIFAHYLEAYPGIKIYVEGEELKPENAYYEKKSISFELTRESTGENIPFTIIMYHWRHRGIKKRFFCGENGVIIKEDSSTGIAKVENFGHSINIKSPYFDKLARNGQSLLLDGETLFDDLVDKSKFHLRNFLRKRLAERASTKVKSLKKSGVYPYKDEPTSPIEIAERQLFDIYAEKILSHPTKLIGGSTQSQELVLNLLKDGLEKDPKHLMNILHEVIKLPENELKDLDELLNTNSLSDIIRMGNLVIERLRFIDDLKNIFSNDIEKDRIKERSHFHKIVEKERWIFGDEYELGTSDKSLSNILKKHREILNKDNEDDENANPNLADIPDLFFHRSYPRNDEKTDHLIVELKRPNKTLSTNEFNQIEKYAFTVASNENFDKEKVSWKFILLGNRVADSVGLKRHQKGSPKFCISNPEGVNIEIYVYTWGEFFNQLFHRYSFLKQKLDDSFDGTGYIKEKYAEFLPDDKLSGKKFK